MTSSISTGTEDNGMEETGKKGSRGGKRSVTHLSKAQLARKRANDREAQRNIRLRNKEHVGALERQIALLQKREEAWEARIKTLQDGLRLEYMQRVKLEAENKMLRAQLPVVPNPQPDDRVLEESLIPQKYADSWVQVLPEPMPVTTYAATDQIYAATMAYDDAEVSQQLYTTTADPMWDDSVAYTQPMIKPIEAWTSTPFQVTMAQPRYGYPLVDNSHVYPDANATAASWPTQPSPPSWQGRTRLKPPATQIDHLVMSIIEAQRQLGGQLPTHDIPPVQALINQPTPARLTPKLAKIMAGYNSLLSTRGFANMPERLASFIVMYRFISFLISPSPATFGALYAWQRPQRSQLTIPHPPWMDFPPWPRFRDRLIAAQDRYDTPEFRGDYAANLSINFPVDPARAVVVVDGQLRVSDLTVRHLEDVENASMRRPFAEKYPELGDVCRFDEV